MEKTDHIIALISNIRDKSNKLIVNELKKASILDLAPSHGSILQLLFSTKESLSMQDISIKINRDKSTVTSLINKLIKLRYVEKVKNADDNRVSIITLTEKGWQLKPIFDAVSQKLLDSIYRGFDNDQKKEVVDVLVKINSNL